MVVLICVMPFAAVLIDAFIASSDGGCRGDGRCSRRGRAGRGVGLLGEWRAFGFPGGGWIGKRKRKWVRCGVGLGDGVTGSE